MKRIYEFDNVAWLKTFWKKEESLKLLWVFWNKSNFLFFSQKSNPLTAFPVGIFVFKTGKGAQTAPEIKQNRSARSSRRRILTTELHQTMDIVRSWLTYQRMLIKSVGFLIVQALFAPNFSRELRLAGVLFCFAAGDDY